MRDKEPYRSAWKSRTRALVECSLCWLQKGEFTNTDICIANHLWWETRALTSPPTLSRQLNLFSSSGIGLTRIWSVPPWILPECIDHSVKYKWHALINKYFVVNIMARYLIKKKRSNRNQMFQKRPFHFLAGCTEAGVKNRENRQCFAFAWTSETEVNRRRPM